MSLREQVESSQQGIVAKLVQVKESAEVHLKSELLNGNMLTAKLRGWSLAVAQANRQYDNIAQTQCTIVSSQTD